MWRTSFRKIYVASSVATTTTFFSLKKKQKTQTNEKKNNKRQNEIGHKHFIKLYNAHEKKEKIHELNK